VSLPVTSAKYACKHVVNCQLPLDDFPKCSRRGPNVMKCYWGDPGKILIFIRNDIAEAVCRCHTKSPNERWLVEDRRYWHGGRRRLFIY
jgi:hypothetical protein